MDLKTKILNGVVMGVSAFVVTGVINTGWKLATGEEPPREDDDGSLARLVLFAGLSAVTVAATQRLISNQLKKRLL